MTYVLTGYKWGELAFGRPAGTISFGLDPTLYSSLRAGSGSIGAFEVAARLAFETWAQVADVAFVHAAEGETPDITLDLARLSFQTVGQAVTFFFPRPGLDEVVASEVTLNSARTWAPFGDGGLNFYNVVLHEIGHSLGLDHPDDTAQVMYELYQTDETLRLGAGDIAGMRFLYGGGDGRVPLILGLGDDLVTRTGAQGEIIFGLAGNDRILGAFGPDRISAGSGDDRVLGGGGNDDIADLMGNGTIRGEDGNDRIFAGIGRNAVDGGPGDDLILGGTGPDTLLGGDGRDVILGDPWGAPQFGSDRLDGGPGDDLLTGGGGADTFVFRSNGGHDRVARFDMAWDAPLTSRAEGRDFTPGLDRIEFETGTFATAAEVRAATETVDGNAVIRFGAAVSLTLHGVAADELGADSFVFGGPFA